MHSHSFFISMYYIPKFNNIHTQFLLLVNITSSKIKNKRSSSMFTYNSIHCEIYVWAYIAGKLPSMEHQEWNSLSTMYSLAI